MSNPRGLRPAFAALLMLAPAVHGDSLDDCVSREMREHGIPGVSLAIIKDLPATSDPSDKNAPVISTRVPGKVVGLIHIQNGNAFRVPRLPGQ